jgi:hypothetical protein
MGLLTCALSTHCLHREGAEAPAEEVEAGAEGEEGAEVAAPEPEIKVRLAGDGVQGKGEAKPRRCICCSSCSPTRSQNAPCLLLQSHLRQTGHAS